MLRLICGYTCVCVLRTVLCVCFYLLVMFVSHNTTLNTTQSEQRGTESGFKDATICFNDGQNSKNKYCWRKRANITYTIRPWKQMGNSPSEHEQQSELENEQRELRQKGKPLLNTKH